MFRPVQNARTRNTINSYLLIALHRPPDPSSSIMASTLRSLRPLARHAVSVRRGTQAQAGRVGVAPLLTQTQRRGYKREPARDMMTGEVIQLPDIDVSMSS